MKKLLLFTSAFLLIAGTTMAGQASLFSYNHDAVAIEMAALNTLEDFVIANPGVSLADMQAAENELVAGMGDANAFYGFDMMNDKALGIGGFLWGCCLGPVGVLVVWLVADDPSETKKSIYGCIVNALLGGSGWFYQTHYYNTY